jgi:hypothetical protein
MLETEQEKKTVEEEGGEDVKQNEIMK